jgi:hypothetical protein
MQWIGQARGLAHQRQVGQVDLVVGGHDSLVNAQRVIGPINAEGGLNDRKIDVELDAGRGPQLEVGTWGDRQLRLLVHQRKHLIDVVHTGLIELQRALVQNSHGSGIEEQSHAHGTGYGDAVFEIGHPLQIAAREGDGVGQQGHRERNDARICAADVARIGHQLIEGAGNVGNRRDGADIESPNVVLAPQIEAAVGWHFLAAVTGGPRAQETDTDGIAAMVDGNT